MVMAVGFLIIIAIGQLTIGTVVGAVILRAACALFNKLFGQGFAEPVEELTLFPRNKPPQVSDDNPFRSPVTPAKSDTPLEVIGGVSVPEFGQALAIMFFSMLSAFVFSFLLGAAFGSSGVVEALGRDTATITAMVLGGLSGLAIQSLFISNMLPTTIGRAFAISIFMLLISFVLIGGIALVAGGAGALIS